MIWRDLFWFLLSSLLFASAIYWRAIAGFYYQMADCYRSKSQGRRRRRHLIRMLGLNSALLSRTKPFQHRCNQERT